MEVVIVSARARTKSGLEETSLERQSQPRKLSRHHSVEAEQWQKWSKMVNLGRSHPRRWRGVALGGLAPFLISPSNRYARST